MTVAMIVLAFLFCSVSGYMAGIVGSSNDPVSGMIISTILAASALLLVLTHGNAVAGPGRRDHDRRRGLLRAARSPATICRISSAAHLIGATPWRQQVMLAIGAFTSAR